MCVCEGVKSVFEGVIWVFDGVTILAFEGVKRDGEVSHRRPP